MLIIFVIRMKIVGLVRDEMEGENLVFWRDGNHFKENIVLEQKYFKYFWWLSYHSCKKLFK